jgi:long-subunit fatty acid transport protein
MLRVDLAYLLLLFSEREVTDSEFSLPDGTKFNGTYQNTAHLFGVNFSYAIN